MNLKPYLAVGAICIIWGTTYLAIRIGVKDFPPFLFSGLRFLLAGTLITAYYLLKGYSWPSRTDFGHLMVSGLCIFLGGNLLLCIAEKNIPSGLAALINCGFPLWIVIISKLIHKAEKISTLTIAGILIGFMGQVLIFYDQLRFLATPAFLSGVIFSFMGVFFGSLGSVYMKKHSMKSNPVFLGGVQMLCCGLVISLIGFFKGEVTGIHISTSSWQAFMYLAIAGSVIGYSSFCYALSHLPATFVSIYTYINPIVALWLGWLILNEGITPSMILAMCITITGVYIVKKGTTKAANIA